MKENFIHSKITATIRKQALDVIDEEKSTEQYKKNKYVNPQIPFQLPWGWQISSRVHNDTQPRHPCLQVDHSHYIVK